MLIPVLLFLYLSLFCVYVYPFFFGMSIPAVFVMRIPCSMCIPLLLFLRLSFFISISVVFFLCFETREDSTFRQVTSWVYLPSLFLDPWTHGCSLVINVSTFHFWTDLLA